MGFGTAKLLVIWSLLTFIGASHAADLCAAPQLELRLTRPQAVRVIAKEKGYTEGLIFSSGYLYESVGLYGQSALRRIDPYTGIAQNIRELDAKYFAEGLAETSGRLVQLTFHENVAFIHSGPDTATVPLPGEGWGLTAWNGDLVKSDGSARLLFLDAGNFAVKRKLTVRLKNKTIDKLNELESARGAILANIFGDTRIAMIQPADGCIFGTLDLSALRAEALRDTSEAKCYYGTRCLPDDFAANGIAYDNVKDELYVTGKNWPFIYVFKFPR